jgi:hypothetical protein
LLATSSTWLFGHTPLLSGSGKFDTPCERTQWEKASGCEVDDRERLDPPTFDAPDEPPHALATRATQIAAMIVPAVRTLGSHGRRGRCMTEMLSFIVPSSVAC